MIRDLLCFSLRNAKCWAKVKIDHPHITGTESRTNQNSDQYLIVYTDFEVSDFSHPEYDAKLAAELEEAVLTHFGKNSPYGERILFRYRAA